MSKQFLKTDKILIDSALILDKKKIKYWLCHGTLLGIIRDKSLIKWDHDIDIGIWKKDLRYDLKENFIKKGFRLKKKIF
jgi:phosphorylcholine metabolism protein LicD